jgi:hypothetical protein
MNTFSNNRWTSDLAFRLISSSLSICCLNTLGDSDTKLDRSSLSRSKLSARPKPLNRNPIRPAPLPAVDPAVPVPPPAAATSPGLPFSPPAPAFSKTRRSSRRPFEMETVEHAEMEATIVRRKKINGVWSDAVLPKCANSLR